MSRCGNARVVNRTALGHEAQPLVEGDSHVPGSRAGAAQAPTAQTPPRRRNQRRGDTPAARVPQATARGPICRVDPCAAFRAVPTAPHLGNGASSCSALRGRRARRPPAPPARACSSMNTTRGWPAGGQILGQPHGQFSAGVMRNSPSGCARSLCQAASARGHPLVHLVASGPTEAQFHHRAVLLHESRIRCPRWWRPGAPPSGSGRRATRAPDSRVGGVQERLTERGRAISIPRRTRATSLPAPAARFPARRPYGGR
jgi:hypothetical protein